MGEVPAVSDSLAASGRAKRAAIWARVGAGALALGSSLLCLHVMWLLNGRTPVRGNEFAAAFFNGIPDSVIRFFQFPLLGTLNLTLILALTGFFVCLLGRWIAGTILAVTLVVALSIANQIKQQMLQEPILWQDIEILADTIGLLRGFVAWWHIALLGATVLLGVLACWLDRPLRLPRLKLRLRALGLVLCCLVPTAIIMMPPMVAEHYIGLPAIDDPRQDYQQVLLAYARSHGLLLSLLFSRLSDEIAQPPDYGPQSVGELATRLVNETAEMATASPTRARKPHVIAIMYESLWDPTQLPGVTITPDPLATFRNPPGNAHAFKLLSPVFGRPTANVEFEFLTGMSTSFLRRGVIPYLGMMHAEVPGLPKLFRENGYRALAIHPYNCEFWRRDLVYPELGFERFEDIVGFYPSDVKGHYVSDDAVASHIIRCIDEAKKPTFLFAVTMQNHAPHERSEYTDYDVTVSHPDTALNDDALVAYSQGVYDADQSLRRIIEHFSKSDQPVVLIAFGDHLVPLSGVYTASGYRQLDRDNSPAQRVKVRATPAIIWTNMPDRLPKIAPITSPNFIPPSLLEFLGISDPYFTGLLGEGRNICPGLSWYVDADPSGKPTLNEPEGSRQFLREYRLLQFDLLQGDHYALEWLGRPEEGSAATHPAHAK